MGVRHACGDSSVLGFEHSAISGRGQPTIDGVYLFTESWLRSPAGKKFWVNAFRKMLADEARESSGDGRVGSYLPEGNRGEGGRRTWLRAADPVPMRRNPNAKRPSRRRSRKE
mmetsp:Transcript_8361/g.24016  ORF Transcript_8361/g.24016 Transcript_8361/m.24016 type:complete len:113 (-) Transcript_8361:36-374(-)